VGNCFRKQGWDVISVDINPAFEPTINVDILTWDYQSVLTPLTLKVVACSPPCTAFRSANTRGVRDLDKGNALVQKCLEIVHYLQPDFWFLENPRLGLLKNQDYMQDIPYVDIDYCQFCDWGYQKPTRFWGSPEIGRLAPVKCNGRDCVNPVTRNSGNIGHQLTLGATP